MRTVACCLVVVALLLAGCIMLDVTPISAAERAGARYVTTQPLNLYGSFGNYPEKTITSYFVVPYGIANRFHTEIGTLPADTAFEIVDMLDRTALGIPHSVIYRVRLDGEVATRLGLNKSLVEISNHRLIEQVKDGTPRLREEFFRRL